MFNKINMTNSLKMSARLNIQDDQIVPWQAEQSTILNGIDSPFSPYPHIKHPKISSNPQSTPKASLDRPRSRQTNNNFYDNLRKYETKKAQELQLKHSTNFIEKNRKQIFEELSISGFQEEQLKLAHRQLFKEQKLVRGISQQNRPEGQMTSWSVIMYYDNDRRTKKHYHKDIQAFLRSQTHKNGHSTSRSKQTPQQDNPRQEQDSFQKMLKLREGIRRRNLKGATSKQNLQKNRRPSQDENQMLRSTIHSQYQPQRKNKPNRPAPQTSSSNRQKHSQTFKYHAQVKSLSNSIALNRNDPQSEVRMIHSSNRGRNQSKVLNIQGNKLCSA